MYKDIDVYENLKNVKVIGKYYVFSKHWESWNLNFGS